MLTKDITFNTTKAILPARNKFWEIFKNRN